MSMTSTGELIEKIARAIQESPIRLMSDDEVAQGTQLTEGEFQARAKKFINDAESGIPGGQLASNIATAILAKTYRRRLSSEVANRLMQPLLEPGKPTPPAPDAAEKQRRFQGLKKAMNKAIVPPKTSGGMDTVPHTKLGASKKPARNATQKSPFKPTIKAPTKKSAPSKPAPKPTPVKKPAAKKASSKKK